MTLLAAMIRPSRDHGEGLRGRQRRGCGCPRPRAPRRTRPPRRRRHRPRPRTRRPARRCRPGSHGSGRRTRVRPIARPVSSRTSRAATAVAALARLDQAGHRLDQPGLARAVDAAGAELLDQDDEVLRRDRRAARRRPGAAPAARAAAARSSRRRSARGAGEHVELVEAVMHPLAGRGSRKRGSAVVAAHRLRPQVKALKVIRVKVSFTPGRVCTSVVTKRPMSTSSSRWNFMIRSYWPEIE